MAHTIDLKIGPVTTKALVARPAGNAKVPGVVITHHRGGLDEITDWMVDNTAKAGFAVIAPNHYHVLPSLDYIEQRTQYISDEQMGRDLQAGVDWLKSQPNVDATRLALIGTCMGGRATLSGLETLAGTWKCGVMWYGGGTHRTLSGKLPSPETPERLKQITCPVMGLYGNDDKNPTPEDVNRLDAALTAHGKEHVFYRYDGAGHGFINLFNPTGYREKQAKDSWEKAMAYLHRHLDAKVPAE
jgi:carboxymethylenebutenolidase